MNTKGKYLYSLINKLSYEGIKIKRTAILQFNR